MTENGKDPTNAAFEELCAKCGHLMVNVGLIASIAPRWSEEVQENFVEKIVGVVGNIEREIGEFQDFAEAWDDDAGS